MGLATTMSLALAGMGCEVKEATQDTAETLTKIAKEDLAQGTRYMAQLFKEKSHGRPFLNLDLGDPQQYTFVIQRLLHAGKTPANSPQLFRKLTEIHAAHRASFASKSRAGGAKQDGVVTAGANAGGGGTRCGHFLTTPGSVSENRYHADSSAMMSCFNGMDFVSIDQAIYETDEDETFLKFLTSNFQEDFGGIEVRTPILRGSVATGNNRSVLVDSFAFASDDITGEFEATFTRYKTEAESPASIRTGSAGALADGPEACCQFEHPRDSTGDGNIRMCYRRTFTAGTGDCDYAAIGGPNGDPGVAPFTHIAMLEQNASGQWVPSATERWPIPNAPVASVPNLFLPMMGVFNAGTRLSNGSPCRIQQLIQPDIFAAVHLRTTGGWCAGSGTALPDDGGQLFQSLRRNFTELGIGTNEIPFGTDANSGAFDPILDFGPDCLQNLQDACLHVNISARTSCNDGGSPPNFTRTASCEVCFDVRNSCFAAGTEIRRADGTTVAVESVKVGDKILAREGGGLLTVTATTRGVEPDPMVRLKDSRGHELVLTAKHPVITTRGAVPADEVTVMSQVETEDGLAIIVEVSRVPYDGQVYSLSVGTPEEIAMVSGSHRTMFAGGIRVGDNEMQFEMERQRTRDGAKRAAAPAWAADRANATVRQQRVKN